MWRALSYLTLVCVILERGNTYETGSTTAACQDMRPQHGVPAQTIPSPYNVRVSKNTYRAHEEIEVTISGSQYFSGFLLEARSTDRSEHVGHFQPKNQPNIKTLGCGQGDAATNSRRLDVNSLTIIWRAPSQTVGVIEMTATVVKDTYTFWLMIKSDPLTEILPTLPVNFPGGTPPFGDPQKPMPDLSEDGPNLVPITTESFDIRWTYLPCSNPPEVEFDVTADISDVSFGSAWIAIAFSKDRYMGDDSVVECLKLQNNQIVIRASYNQIGMKNNMAIQGVNIGLTALSARAANGKFNCRFRRAVYVSGDPRMFDLTTQKYYLLTARGTTAPGGFKLPHSNQYKRSPLVSTELIDFQKSGSLATIN